MIETPKSPPMVPFIQNPFDKQNTTPLNTALDTFKQVPVLSTSSQIETRIASTPFIQNPFKNSEFNRRSERLFKFPKTTTSNNFSIESSSQDAPSQQHLATAAFEKYKQIREKTKELVDLEFIQNEKVSKHQAKMNELDKRNAAALEELRRYEASLAAMDAIEEEEKAIESRIAYLKDSQQKLEAQLAERVSSVATRRTQIHNITEESRRKIQTLEHELDMKASRLKALQTELHQKSLSVQSSTSVEDLANANKKLAQVMLTSEGNRNTLEKLKNELEATTAQLEASKEDINSNMENLRKLKSLNERLKLLTSNFQERISLSQSGRITSSSGSEEGLTIIQSSLQKVTAVVANVKTLLSNNHDKIAVYCETVSQRLDKLEISDSDEQAAPWDEIYEKFCKNRRKYPDILSAMESSESPEKKAPVDHPAETFAFDAKIGLNLVSQTEPDTAEPAKDYMGDASIFQTESIWVFQEPKSEIIDKADEPIPPSEFEFLQPPSPRPKAPITPSEFDFLRPNSTRHIEPTQYPLPDMGITDNTPRTPSRKRYFPTPASELPCDASIALFEWESVLPPSPHEKRQTRVDLSMDFLRD